MDDPLKLKHEIFQLQTQLSNEILRRDCLEKIEIPKLKNQINTLAARIAEILRENDELKFKLKDHEINY